MNEKERTSRAYKEREGGLLVMRLFMLLIALFVMVIGIMALMEPKDYVVPEKTGQENTVQVSLTSLCGIGLGGIFVLIIVAGMAKARGEMREHRQLRRNQIKVVKTEGDLLSMINDMQTRYPSGLEYVVDIDAEKWDFADVVNARWVSKKHPYKNVTIRRLKLPGGRQ